MTRRTFLKVLAGAGVAAISVDAFAIEPNRLEITKHNVTMPKLPGELNGLKIVQLSDLHRSSIVPDDLIRSAVKMTNDLSPDIVVLTGDFVSNTSENARPCAEMLSELRTRIGTYAVLGNHDHWAGRETVIARLKDHGIMTLVNQNIEPAPGLVLLGLDDYWVGAPNFTKTWKGADPSAAQIFLSHNPFAVSKMNSKDCLMLSGHTHGGQAIISFIPIGSLPALRRWKYIKGWYNVGNTRLYVNRGIGMINPPIRFMCSPEITQFTLFSH